MESRTIKALSEINDEGLFERIATGVLRLQPTYERLIHTGINADGKTRKAPVDGIGLDGNRIVVTHHTITAASGLERKWLLDPAKVKQRPDTKTEPVPGDVVKSLSEIRNARRQIGDLKATIVLTTNQEPDSDLFVAVVAAARTENVDVDIWSRSRIAAILDTDGRGQYIRSKLLEIEEDTVSLELIAEVGWETVEALYTGDEPSLRVSRLAAIEFLEPKPITFVVGGSGTGKTIACLQVLQHHRDAGGLVMVMSNEVLEAAQNLDQAIIAALRRFRPTLREAQVVTTLLGPNATLSILIEDVARSSKPRQLIEKLIAWLPDKKDSYSVAQNGNGGVRWRIFCPVWPQFTVGLSKGMDTTVKANTMLLVAMSDDEALATIRLRAISDGIQISDFQATKIAKALGNDPLLISLNQDWKTPDPAAVIASFVDAALDRASAGSEVRQHFLASELRSGLRSLGEGILAHRSLEPTWDEIAAWQISSEALAAIKELTRASELIALRATSGTEKLVFRHDRVRHWIIADAAEFLLKRSEITDEVLADPLFASTFGAILARCSNPDQLIERLKARNPLALFFAIEAASKRSLVYRERLAAEAASWLKAIGLDDRATVQMRWDALLAIRDVEGPFMLDLLNHFPKKWIPSMIARMCNSDVEGALELCLMRSPAEAAIWLTTPIAQAYAAAGPRFISAISEEFDRCEAGSKRAAALLSFAGAWGEETIAPAISRLWERDKSRTKFLSDYLWAFMRTSTRETAHALLEPVCLEWAKLPIEDGSAKHLTRYNLAAFEVRSAFLAAPPRGAFEYLFRRAESDDLAWAIEYLLSALDDPDVLQFNIEMAARRKRGGQAGRSPAIDHWHQAGEGLGKPMSHATRSTLPAVWRAIEVDPDTRTIAFDLWSATRGAGDIEMMIPFKDDLLLAERILRQRLRRGDHEVIADLAGKLNGSDGAHWWHYTRYVWSPALTDALDRRLSAIAVSQDEREEKPKPGVDVTWIVLRRPREEAQKLLQKHWDAFGQGAPFILAALHLSTPEMLSRAAASLENHDNPQDVFDSLAMQWGLNWQDGPGISREEQVLALKPYLHLIDGDELERVAEACNRASLFDIRRRVIDGCIGESRSWGAQYLVKNLDRHAGDRVPHIIDHVIEEFLKGGDSWSDACSALHTWLSSRDDRGALEIAARAIVYSGSADDVICLRAWKGHDPGFLESVIADTVYNVSSMPRAKTKRNRR
jgi:hypothetical protein